MCWVSKSMSRCLPLPYEQRNETQEVDALRGKLEIAEEVCKRMISGYQHQFEGSVPSLKAEDLLAQYSPNDVLLVDCRTKLEQAVSMIQGAVPLDELDVKNLPKDKTIVTYCSVGYRSGLEAERLKDVLKVERLIFNLDGILAYTHALEKRPDAPPLIDPSTKEQTRKVHSFAKQWDCAADVYETTQFSAVATMLHMGQVAGLTIVRKTQHVIHKLSPLSCKES